jgi:WD40 repeat protein
MNSFAVSLITFDVQLVSSARDTTMRTWRPDLKAAISTAPDDQLPPPVEYFSNQTVRLDSGNVTVLAFSRKGMLVSGSDDHVVSIWNLDSVSAAVSVVWTSRGKVDVHDGTSTLQHLLPLSFINFIAVGQAGSHV